MAATVLWHRDGDQWVFHGFIGEYRISLLGSPPGPNYLTQWLPGEGLTSMILGEVATLKQAKRVAAIHDQSQIAFQAADDDDLPL